MNKSSNVFLNTFCHIFWYFNKLLFCNCILYYKKNPAHDWAAVVKQCMHIMRYSVLDCSKARPAAT